MSRPRKVTIFVAGLDVEKDPTKPCGWKEADRHYGSGPESEGYLGKKMYGHLRTQGAAAALKQRLLTLPNGEVVEVLRCVFSGKQEQRYGAEEVTIRGFTDKPWQGLITSVIMQQNYGIAPSLIDWITPPANAEGATAGSMSSVTKYMRGRNLQQKDILYLSNEYHRARCEYDLASNGLREIMFVSAESLICALEPERRPEILQTLQEPDYAARVLDEMIGDGRKWCGLWKPSTPQSTGKATTA